MSDFGLVRGERQGDCEYTNMDRSETPTESGGITISYTDFTKSGMKKLVEEFKQYKFSLVEENDLTPNNPYMVK